MEIFNKTKKPSLKKKAMKKDKNKLSKYLPTILFIGVQEDINEKALISYITSLAQSAFNNPKEAKYSIRKMGKSKYVYEIHNGSEDLTYLPMVVSRMIEGNETELILKTNGQNVRVLRKTSVKIESNVLIQSNNRDEDATVDYESKGELKYIVKQGSEVFIISALSLIVTGFIAGASFVSKYYMMNEEYSYNPDIREAPTAVDFLRTISPSEHTKYRYLESVNYINYTWVKKFKEIEPPVVEVAIEDVAIEENSNDLVEHNIESNILVKEDNIINTDEAEISNQVVNVSNNERTPIEMTITKEEFTSTNIEDKVENKDSIVNNKDIEEDFEITEFEEVVNEEVNMEGYVVASEDDLNNLDTSDIPSNIVVVEEENAGFFGNDFEILNEENIESLDLSNLPENIVLE